MSRYTYLGTDLGDDFGNEPLPGETHNDPTFGNTDPPRGTVKQAPARPNLDKHQSVIPAAASPMNFAGPRPDLPPVAGTTQGFVPNYYGDDEFVGTAAAPLTPVQLNRNLVPGLRRSRR